MRSLSGFYDVQTENGRITCRGRGSLRRGSDIPLTGDMVEITIEQGKGMIEKILPRRNRFVRPAVANMDALVVFASNVNPVTEPFLIDRVAAIAGDQGVAVHICINKCDLDPAADLTKIYKNAGFPVIQASAVTGEGVEELRQLIAGKFTAFTGNTGVGKSSMLNALMPQLQLPPVRCRNSWAAAAIPHGMWSSMTWAAIPMLRIRRALPPSIRSRWM